MDTSAAAAQRVAALDDADLRLSFNAVARGQRWEVSSVSAHFSPVHGIATVIPRPLGLPPYR